MDLDAREKMKSFKKRSEALDKNVFKKGSGALGKNRS